MTEKNISSPSEEAQAGVSSSSESSAGYIAAGSAPARASGGSGVFALIILAILVGASLALFLVRESPWLAQKILKEQQTQLPEAPTQDSAEASRDAEPGVLVPTLPVSPATPPVALVPSIDPLLVQRLAQVQQWSVVLRAVPAGPIDPSSGLVSVFSATPSREVSESSPAAPTVGDGSTVAEPPVGRLGLWFDTAVANTGRFLASLVRVQQVSDPSLPGQSQAFFAQVDQRVQSHLMAARLLLLHGQAALVVAELDALLELLQRFYEPGNPRIDAVQSEIVALRNAIKDPV